MAQYEAARSRTKENIRHSFWSLYTSGNFTRVRVSDITEKAGIHRSTFYSYFDSVDEIFDSIKEQQLDLLKQVCALRDPASGEYDTFLTELQRLFDENRLYLKPLLAEYHSSSFSLAYRQILKELLWSDVRFPAEPDDTREHALMDAVISGMIEMLICSLEDPRVTIRDAFLIARGMMENGAKPVLQNHFGITTEITVPQEDD